MLSAVVSVTNKTTAIYRAITNFTLNYTLRCKSIPLCNDRPITVYPLIEMSVTVGHSKIHHEISVDDVKQEQCATCCPDTVSNTPILTDKQHNMYTVWTPIPYTVLVLHSSSRPNTNINTQFCDRPVCICTLLKEQKTHIFPISSHLNKTEGKPIFNAKPYLITQLPNSTIPQQATHWSAKW